MSIAPALFIVAAAVPDEVPGEMHIFLISMVMIIVALILGTGLYYVSQRTSTVRGDLGPAAPQVDDASSQSLYVPQLIAALNRLTLSPAQRQQIAQSMQAVLNEQIALMKQESTIQRQQMMAERQQSEDRLRAGLQLSRDDALCTPQQTSDHPTQQPYHQAGV